jgi:hypothetical protein
MAHTRRTRQLLLAVLLIVLLVVAAGCGQSKAQRAAARARTLNLLAPELSDRLAKQAAAEKTACETSIGDFLDAVGGIDSRLDVGMTFSDYSSKVADANVAHDRVDASSLSGKCLTSGGAAEKALNSYIKAYNKWNDCINDDYCDTDSITPSLQAIWSQATTQDRRAKDAVESIAGATSYSLGARYFPRSSKDVDNTIYGTISTTICKTPDPPAAVGPCTDYRNTLAGGIQPSEEGKLDAEMKDLVKALGLVPTT